MTVETEHRAEGGEGEAVEVLETESATGLETESATGLETESATVPVFP